MEHPSANKSETRQLSRRSVVRTAAHGAWAIPAIQVAATVPAYAATSDPLKFTAGSGVWTVPLISVAYVSVSTTVRNDSTTDSTANLQITVQFPTLYVYSPLLGETPLTISNITGGWTSSVSYSGTGTGRTATVTFTAATQLTANAENTLTFRATTGRYVINTSGSDNLTLTATATNHETASRTINPTA